MLERRKTIHERRMGLTEQQIEKLEEEYEDCPYSNVDRKKELAEEFKVDFADISRWFNDRRQKDYYRTDRNELLEFVRTHPFNPNDVREYASSGSSCVAIPITTSQYFNLRIVMAPPSHMICPDPTKLTSLLHCPHVGSNVQQNQQPQHNAFQCFREVDSSSVTPQRNISSFNQASVADTRQTKEMQFFNQKELVLNENFNGTSSPFVVQHEATTATPTTTNASSNQGFGDRRNKESKDLNKETCDHNQNNSPDTMLVPFEASPLDHLCMLLEVGTEESSNQTTDPNEPGPSGISRSHPVDCDKTHYPHHLPSPHVGQDQTVIVTPTTTIVSSDQPEVAQHLEVHTHEECKDLNKETCDDNQNVSQDTMFLPFEASPLDHLCMLLEVGTEESSNQTTNPNEPGPSGHNRRHPVERSNALNLHHWVYPRVVLDQTINATPTTTTNVNSNQAEATKSFGDRSKSEFKSQNEVSCDRNQNGSLVTRLPPLAPSRLHKLWSPLRVETGESHHRTIDPNLPGPSGISYCYPVATGKSHNLLQIADHMHTMSPPDVGRDGRINATSTANQPRITQSKLGKRQTKNEDRSGFSQWTQKLVKVFPRNRSIPPQKKVKIAADRGSIPCRATQSSANLQSMKFEPDEEHEDDLKSSIEEELEEAFDQSKQAFSNTSSSTLPPVWYFLSSSSLSASLPQQSSASNEVEDVGSTGVGNDNDDDDDILHEPRVSENAFL
ncbi:uncharacterized protein LOC143459880 isoform X1 [Clavelina lepadiformis]|uniref:uncharacterized protein LOC143459880 isoform X1 n=2 Tax=Clavelina lepadiformis TaxID=159417 RepID=UPI0040415B99